MTQPIQKRMVVLQLISTEGFYGAESMLCTLARTLSRLGCEPVVGVFRDSRNPHIEVAEAADRFEIRVQVIPCAGRLDWATVKNIRLLLKELSVNVLHSHGYKADLYGYLASRNLGVARVSTCHGWPDPQLLMQTYASLNRMGLRGFDEVTTPSAEVSEILLRSGIRADRLSVIRNGVDVDAFRDASPTVRQEVCSNGEPVVGFVGRLVPEKGGAELIRAARNVLTTRPDARFVFVGEGACREEWRTLSAQLGVASRVVFTGARQDMPGVYASMDVFTLPSYKEAMPMAILEAMSAGRPVIASSVGAVGEVVKDHETGILCVPGDIEGLSKAILHLLEDPRRAQRWGENGYSRVVAGFSAEAMAKMYLAVYHRALERRRPCAA